MKTEQRSLEIAMLPNLICIFPGVINFEAKMDSNTVLNINDTTIAFHEACINGNLHLAISLLSNKEEIDLTQLEEKNTLAIVIGQEHEEILKLLLKIGMNVNQQVGVKPFQRTLLHHACLLNPNPTIVKILLENGAFIEATDYSDATPLIQACCTGSFKVVQLLIQHHAVVHARDTCGQTPLHLACLSNRRHFKIVQELLKHKPDVNAIASRQWHGERTPLTFAVMKGSLEIVEALLLHGADVNFSDSVNGNSLNLAVRKGHLKIAKTLLKNGCNTNTKEKMFDENEDCTAFESSLHLGNTDMLKVLAFNEN